MSVETEKTTIVAVGDLFLDAATLREVIAPSLPENVNLRVIQWHTDGKEELQKYNLQCEQQGPEGIEPPAELLDLVRDANILFTQFCPISTCVLDAAQKLRVIGVGRSGVENINVVAATERGISVLNTVGRNAQAVAEYTIGLLLCEARNIGRGHASLKQGEWRKKYANDATVPELPGKTLGLVGLGKIGAMVVRKLAGFDMRCIAYDPYANAVMAGELGVELVDLETLLRTSDFVSVHARLTEETRHLLNAEKLALMKPTAYLINTARAELIDEQALVEVLGQGRIAGAALDVFMNEPPAANDPLLTLDNLTLSPHQAGVTADAYRTTAKLFLDNIASLWNGDSLPANLINKETADNLQQFKQAIMRD